MKSFLTILKWVAASFSLLVICFIVFVSARGGRTFEAPLPDLIASKDSAAIARGKYLVYGPGHCATCHMPMEKFDKVEAGAEIPLMGGWELAIPPGTFRAPNLTPDHETGIGTFSDGELARAIRYSVRKDGSALFPFMPFQDMSDEDIVAIISFLRSQPPIDNFVEETELSFMGKAAVALGLIGPVYPTTTPPRAVKIDSTLEYGRYVANAIANCRGCHTTRDLKTGAFIGDDFAGGMIMKDDPMAHGYSFISPNITPHPTDGVMTNWSEATFIHRFKSGRIHKGSPMPWGAFAIMTELELKAVYRYLQSLEPAPGKFTKTVFAPGEAVPG